MYMYSVCICAQSSVYICGVMVYIMIQNLLALALASNNKKHMEKLFESVSVVTLIIVELCDM